MSYSKFTPGMPGLIREGQKSALQLDLETRMARQRFAARVAAYCWAGVLLILLGAILWHWGPTVVKWAIPWATGR